MAVDAQLVIVLYVLVGAVAGMLYALRRVFLLEKRILRLEEVILNIDRKISETLGHGKRKK